jgi:SP family general alpha glucoside:H+ symporter-like MFS transporter
MRRLMYTLTRRLFVIGGISFPAEEAAGARWGQAAMIMLWVLVFDLTIGVRPPSVVVDMTLTFIAFGILYRWRN